MGISARNSSRMFEPLERVRMTESERRAAEVYLAQGEAVADFIIRVFAFSCTASNEVFEHGHVPRPRIVSAKKSRAVARPFG